MVVAVNQRSAPIHLLQILHQALRMVDGRMSLRTRTIPASIQVFRYQWTTVATTYACSVHTSFAARSFNIGLFPVTAWVNWHQKSKLTILNYNETRGCSGISWTVWKSSAPHSRQITTPAPHHSLFNRPDALSDAQSTVSKHWREGCVHQVAKIKRNKK